MSRLSHSLQWSPAIGDPSLMGWLTVAAYFYCAYKAARVFQLRERIFGQPIRRESTLWLLIAVIMLGLGVNKQLDLQTLFTEIARLLAHEQGWYAERRRYQVAFIAAIGLAGLFALGTLFALYRRVLHRHALAIAGLCLLTVFVLLRASSFHGMDRFISTRLLGLKMNWLLELGAIALVFWNARRLIWQRRALLDMTRPTSPDENTSP